MSKIERRHREQACRITNHDGETSCTKAFIAGDPSLCSCKGDSYPWRNKVRIAQALADIEQAAEERGATRERAALLGEVQARARLHRSIEKSERAQGAAGALEALANAVKRGEHVKPAAGEERVMSAEPEKICGQHPNDASEMCNRCFEAARANGLRFGDYMALVTRQSPKCQRERRDKADLALLAELRTHAYNGTAIVLLEDAANSDGLSVCESDHAAKLLRLLRVVP